MTAPEDWIGLCEGCEEPVDQAALDVEAFEAESVLLCRDCAEALTGDDQ